MISSRPRRHKEALVGTGAKIAIGCVVVAVVISIVAVVALGGLAWWVKGKSDEFTSEQNRIAELQRRANANRFTPPSDGLLGEDRLEKFLDVRRRVYAVYERHQAALEEMSRKKQADFGDVRKGFALINELRLAQAQALADLSMSEDEYRFIAEQAYKTPSAEGGQAAAVPGANAALLRKHEADLKKYQMPGLDWIGL
jgi:hypothetical protein